MIMDYDIIVDAIHALSWEGWSAEEIVRADGYPIYVLTDPVSRGTAESTNKPSLLIAAGIHGEEPAAVVGLKQWLVAQSARWVGRINFTVFPCLNPWGYERGIRFSANGNDLNREFDAPAHPATQAFHDWLGSRRFDLFMDLHEDCDFESMYLYENVVSETVRGRPSLGERILQRAASKVALSHGDEVGDFTTVHGAIVGSLARDEAKRFTQAPIAIRVFAENAPYVVTLETPGLLDLELRADLHGDALTQACIYVTEEGSRIP